MFLGKTITDYNSKYNPDLLDPIPRTKGRDEISKSPLPTFFGYDIWNFYELSWLNPKGKPEVRVALMSLTADSANILESKSVKLYLNSFNNSIFGSEEEVSKTISQDFAKRADGDVQIILYKLQQLQNNPLVNFTSECLDALDIECNEYNLNPRLLTNAINPDMIVTETVHSNLLKSNCLVTNQPDWASVEIKYTGPQIDHKLLLQYIISFRNHNEFHEQCIERIFCDLTQYCKPSELSVYGRYTRRGGVDINPIRTSAPTDLAHLNILRHVRQ